MKWKFFFVPAVLFNLFAFAQPQDLAEDGDDRIESMKIQFITERLDLESSEAQQFWPIYNSYQEELEEIKKTRLDLVLESSESGIEDMTESEAQELIEMELARERKFVDIREEYYHKFKKVITIKKIALLYEAELDFQKKLINRLSEGPRKKPQ